MHVCVCVFAWSVYCVHSFIYLFEWIVANSKNYDNDNGFALIPMTNEQWDCQNFLVEIKFNCIACVPVLLCSCAWRAFEFSNNQWLLLLFSFWEPKNSYFIKAKCYHWPANRTFRFNYKWKCGNILPKILALNVYLFALWCDEKCVYFLRIFFSTLLLLL